MRLIFMVIALSAVLLNGCSIDSSSAANSSAGSSSGPSLTVTFNSWGGSAVAAITLSGAASNTAALPSAPTKAGYTFSGWYTAPFGRGTPFTSSTAVTSNITVYAFWSSDALALVTKRELVSVPATVNGAYTQCSDNDLDGVVTSAGDGFAHDIGAFMAGKYEVTYELWYTVYQWTKLPENGYSISGAGLEGSIKGAGGYPGYSNIGKPPTAAKLQPVTYISWRDAMVWCNAYSEMTGLAPVYFSDAAMTVPLRTSTTNGTLYTNAGGQDRPYVNWSAGGYRLPTEGEWQYAASYKDGTNFTPWNFASGAAACFTNMADVSPADGAPDGKNANDSVAAYQYYWNGTAWASTGVTNTVDAGMKQANLSGLYDMSGNAMEWCWDWYGNYPAGITNNYRGPATGNLRLARGGSFLGRASFLPSGLSGAYDCIIVGNRNSGMPWCGIEGVGFRVAR